MPFSEKEMQEEVRKIGARRLRPDSPFLSQRWREKTEAPLGLPTESPGGSPRQEE